MERPPMVGLGKYLREARKAALLTQRVAAEAIGIDFTYLSKLENDRMPPPSLRTLTEMARVYQQPLADVLRAAGKPACRCDELEERINALEASLTAAGIPLYARDA